MSNKPISDAFAVIVSADGAHHRVCWSADDLADAAAELAAGGKPVVFHRRTARADVVNNAPSGFTGVQAHTINGGVTI